MKKVTAIVAALVLGGCMAAGSGAPQVALDGAHDRSVKIDTCAWSKPRCRDR